MGKFGRRRLIFRPHVELRAVEMALEKQANLILDWHKLECGSLLDMIIT